MKKERICGVCGRTEEPRDDLVIIGDLYCDRHDPKVQMVTEDAIDELYLEYLEKKHGKSIDYSTTSTEGDAGE